MHDPHTAEDEDNTDDLDQADGFIQDKSGERDCRDRREIAEHRRARRTDALNPEQPCLLSDGRGKHDEIGQGQPIGRRYRGESVFALEKIIRQCMQRFGAFA